MTRPVTETLIESLRALLVSHPVIVWLDKDGHYTELVDELIAASSERSERSRDPLDLAAPLVGYRGSYLELLRTLAPLTEGVDPKPLIVHVPGANQDNIRDTPLLELNEAGHQHRVALTTLIQEAAAGRVRAEEVEEFLTAHAGEGAAALSLAAADAWMRQQIALVDDTAQIILRGYEPGALIQALVANAAVVGELGEEPGPVLDHYFGARLGLPAAWPSEERRDWVRQGGAELPRRYADLATSWAMCVEYVHDLERAPEAAVLGPAKELSSPLISVCRATAEHLRGAARGYYVGLADDLEDQLQVEREHGKPEELGRIDTFRFEEDRLLRAALRAVGAREWDKAAIWAEQRLAGASVWLAVDPNRRKAWELIATATSLGRALAASTLAYADAPSLGEAARRYAEAGAPIDGLHRELEQQAASALVDLPHPELVRAAVDAVRARWKQWAEAGAREWSELCEHEGALPDTGMQQRSVFVEVVKPMLDEDRVALFVVDALRYEMARQLVEMIGQPGATSVHLAPRLAELPTITAVGMNALAHVSAGAGPSARLRPKLDGKGRKFAGFEVDGFPLVSRSNRETAYKRAAGGVRWFDLAKLGEESGSLGKQIAKARLVVVHSLAIDKAGENGHGPLVFAQELRELHKAWELLRAAGVRQFVFTSDHGFLLRRPSDDDDEVLGFGKAGDAGARHALYPEPLSDDARLGLRLSELAYEGADEALILPRGLQVFPVARERDFVHGGNSPQERVIPVLSIRHKRAAGAEDQHYRVVILRETVGFAAASNTHVIEARVSRADNQTTLPLELEPVALELRVHHGKGHDGGGEGVMVEVLDCRDAALDAGLITVAVGKRFSLRFRLSSAREQRVRVELVSASAKRRVDPARSTARFDALSPATQAPAASPAPPAPQALAARGAPSHDWLEEIDDLGVRKVLAYIAEHGSITEADLAQLLGHPRKVRRFARDFDDYRKQAPFLMDQTHTAAGKVYRKVSDK